MKHKTLDYSGFSAPGEMIVGERSKFFITSHLSENIKKTPEGFLLCMGVSIARTGEMVYGDGETPLKTGEDGRVIVTRDAEEVFRPETIASFEGKAVTILHPLDFVSPQNWSTLSKGMMQNVRRGTGAQESDLVADLMITDSHAISLVENGLREVSCGYEAEYMQTGVGRGSQKNIVGNHLALVSEGRAGSTYAITDNKGKGSTMKLKDRIKALFAKAQDEAMKMVDENTETPEKKDGFVKDKDEEKKPEPKKDDAKDTETPPSQSSPAEMKDDEGDAMSAMAARLEKLEAAVSKLLESKAGDEAGEGEEEEVGDDDDMGGEGEVEDADESCDEDMEEKKDKAKTGDAASDLASRVEILAPGMNAKAKDAKMKALVAAYATKDGKSIIEKFTMGKAPNFKDAALVESLFVGASELLKAKRSSDLAGSKTFDFKSSLELPEGAKTADEINEINAKHFGSK